MMVIVADADRGLRRVAPISAAGPIAGGSGLMVAFAMTRTEANDRIQSTLGKLSDDRVRSLAELAENWRRPSLFETMTNADREHLQEGIDQADRGEGEPANIVLGRLSAGLGFAS
jgi:hypothetical protein